MQSFQIQCWNKYAYYGYVQSMISTMQTIHLMEYFSIKKFVGINEHLWGHSSFFGCWEDVLAHYYFVIISNLNESNRLGKILKNISFNLHEIQRQTDTVYKSERTNSLFDCYCAVINFEIYSKFRWWKMEVSYCRLQQHLNDLLSPSCFGARTIWQALVWHRGRFVCSWVHLKCIITRLVERL